ncbi:MAG: hypothetical protein ISN26_04895 [Betaproteobacteria bacterium AqS2]|uniref:Uncharacterized protein n=1 Tax=Candidatus Amphirhobacter heronislandensis TaxID=1732024 RepID=A0A930Y1I5_9GAMM|nr:hypothetical protein [Betaproteobacteria bacterium AqS2]
MGWNFGRQLIVLCQQHSRASEVMIAAFLLLFGVLALLVLAAVVAGLFAPLLGLIWLAGTLGA